MDDNPKPARRLRTSMDASVASKQLDITGDTVKIRVGKDSTSKVFSIHENVLQKGSSAFLRNALKPEWRESRESILVTLPDHAPKIFETYVKWLYSDIFDTTLCDNTYQLVQAYGLGEEIMDTAFQNVTMNKLIERHRQSKRRPGSEIMEKVYNSTPAGSPLRKYTLDVWCWEGGDGPSTRSYFQWFPAEFVNDLLIELLKMRPKPGKGKEVPWVKDPKSYLKQDVEQSGSEKEDEEKDEESMPNVSMEDGGSS